MKHKGKGISQRSAAIGLGVLAVATAACGSTQSSTTGTTIKTPSAKTVAAKLKGHYIDGLYVGNYTGQYAQDVVTAKKAMDLVTNIEIAMWDKKDTPAMVDQLQSYLPIGITVHSLGGMLMAKGVGLKAGDTIALTKGTNNLNGISGTPVAVVPTTPFHGRPAVVVTTCGYNGVIVKGPTGKVIPYGEAGDTRIRVTLANWLLAPNTEIYQWRIVSWVSHEMAKCPTNLANQG